MAFSTCVTPLTVSGTHGTGTCFTNVKFSEENAVIRNIGRHTQTESESKRSQMIKPNSSSAQEHHPNPHSERERSTWLCLPAVCSVESNLWETITQLHHMVDTGHHKLTQTPAQCQSFDLTHCCVRVRWRVEVALD